jgi:hypothetical protein
MNINSDIFTEYQFSEIPIRGISKLPNQQNQNQIAYKFLYQNMCKYVRIKYMYQGNRVALTIFISMQRLRSPNFCQTSPNLSFPIPYLSLQSRMLG